MPVQGTKKEKRQYEKIKQSAKKSGKYKGREKEVAARTVMKERSKKKSSSSKKKSSGSKKKSSGSKKKSTSKRKASSRKKSSSSRKKSSSSRKKR